MTKTKSTRRQFFLQGGALVGAGVATTTGAAALSSEDALPLQERLTQLQRQVDAAEDCKAIRELHLAFTTLIEREAYESAAELFDERAHLQLSGVAVTGKSAILDLLADQYRHQKADLIHSAYRQKASQQQDAVTLSDDGLQATAVIHSEVELSTPLRIDSTEATMARLQGQMADRRWETGRFDAQYVKSQGQWRMASLTYSSV